MAAKVAGLTIDPLGWPPTLRLQLSVWREACGVKLVA